MGFGAEIAARVAENSIDAVDTPVNKGGGGGHVRTRRGNSESVTYRFVVAVSAEDAMIAGAAWPILAHGRD
jgi:hypothetical protein